MKLKYIVPNMTSRLLGTWRFDRRKMRWSNSVSMVALFPWQEAITCIADIQRADDIIVVLPAKAGEKRFKYEQKVKLVNPKITAEGKNVRGRGYTNYILTADDMLPAEESK